MLGQIFDTLLGILLMFAVLGIVNSVLVEAVPRILKMLGQPYTRGAILKLAIGNMIGEVRSTSNPAVARLKRVLYAHPLIRSLSETAKDAPSYISPGTFASALVDVLDNQGNAIAMMLLSRAATRPDVLKTLIGDLGDRISHGAVPRDVSSLFDALTSDLTASTQADGSLELKKLACLSLSWPSAFRLVTDALNFTTDTERLTALIGTLNALPSSWRSNGLQPIYDQFNKLFQPADKSIDITNASAFVTAQDTSTLNARLYAYIQAIENWESTSCQISRGVKGTIDGIQYLIDSLPDDLGALRTALRTVFSHLNPGAAVGAADVEKFYAGIENWYCEVTARATGWYKRYARLWGLICAFVICIGVNADAIFVVRALSSDPALRAQVAAAAINFARDYKATGNTPAGSPPPSPSGASNAPKVDDKQASPTIVQPDCITLSNLIDHGQPMSPQQTSDFLNCQSHIVGAGMKYLETSALPIGWSTARQDLVFGGLYEASGAQRSWYERASSVLGTSAFWLWVSGIVISSLAVTIGGEYWFNLLRQVVRLTGSKPRKS